jgi:hypothetical protein
MLFAVNTAFRLNAAPPRRVIAPINELHGGDIAYDLEKLRISRRRFALDLLSR